MYPVLHSGDVIEYKKHSFMSLKVNDIILVKRKGIMMTHRIIYKSKRHLITKGDSNSNSDGKIYPKDIIAKAIYVKRNNQFIPIDQLYLIQSTLYFREIIKIKQAFERKDVDFIFLKGLPLHLYFEGSHPKRIYADCDVLVNKKYFNEAEKILLQSGYQKSDTKISSTQKKLQDKQSEHAYVKMINNMPVVFDLHIEVVFMMTQLGKLEALYPQQLIDRLTAECLQTKKSIKVNGEQFSILNSEFLIFYLALHLFHHNFSGAFRYDFLDKVIRKVCHAEFISASMTTKTLKHREQKFQCKQVQDNIMRFRLQNFVHPVFILLKKYYKTPISQRFFLSIQPVNLLTSKLINQIVKTNIFNDETRIQAGVTRFKYLYYLSPNPWWRKMWVFTNPQVMYTVMWVGWKKMKKLFF